MSLYYLMAQLPSLDNAGEGAPLPITWERFLDLCSAHASKKAAKAMEEFALVPERNGRFDTSSFIDRWNRRERSLRLALGVVRAEKQGREFESEEYTSPELISAVRSAVEASDPLEAERILNRDRMKFIEDNRPADTFSEDALYYYGIKLKLIERFRLFDREAGRTEYKRIYDSVIGGAGQEAQK